MPDTEAARTDMRFASKYLEHKQFDEARDYVASARRKDLDVTLAVKTESKEVTLLTPDSLEADILEQQSLSYAEEIRTLTAEKEKFYKERIKVIERDTERVLKAHGPRAALEEMNRQQIERKYDDKMESQRYAEFHGRIDYLRGEIIKCLEYAIKLKRTKPSLYSFLGNTYVDSKNFVKAVELLTAVQQKWPEDFEIRRALDSALKEQRLQASQRPSPPPAVPFSKTQTIVSLLSIFLDSYLAIL
jgi:hypothetical protein